MLIQVTAGTGEGPTPLAAFDNALHQAGIANFNLIVLSSVIPPNAEIVHTRARVPEGRWGDRLYVVLAQQREVENGTEACAGIGWMREPARGNGLFVEHYGHGDSHVEVQIKESLHAMREYRSEVFGEIEMVTTRILCRDRPVCALVAAVYGSERWDTT